MSFRKAARRRPRDCRGQWAPARTVAGAVLASLALFATRLDAALVVSDGSDGALDAGALPSCIVGYCSLTLPADGVFHFTTIHVPSGVTLYFHRNASNTPVVLAAQGNVTVQGVIEASAWLTDVANPQFAIPEAPKRGGGPGGGDGGLGALAQAGPGAPLNSGGDGQGPGGVGNGGVGHDVVGGGGGHATPGLEAFQYGSPAPGGPMVPHGPVLTGGSGGGGGSEAVFFGGDIRKSGGHGGGGGGGLNLSTPGGIVIEGAIRADGANAAWVTGPFFNGAPGGGGSGGRIDLFASTIALDDGATLSALGGFGGGLSNQQYTNDPAGFSSGSNGGLGFVTLGADVVDIRGTINAVVVPLPPSLVVAGSAAVVLMTTRRRRSAARS